MIGLASVPIDMNRKAFSSLTDDFRIHAGANWAITELLGNAVGTEHFALTLGGGSAMAPHSGNDEWAGANASDVSADGPNDIRDIGDAAAARSNGDALAGADFLPQVQPEKLVFDFGRNIVDLGTIEFLAKTKKLGIHASSHTDGNCGLFVVKTSSQA
jgi:hypothetical protein